jgi:hypothetical protein
MIQMTMMMKTATEESKAVPLLLPPLVLPQLLMEATMEENKAKSQEVTGTTVRRP